MHRKSLKCSECSETGRLFFKKWSQCSRLLRRHRFDEGCDINLNGGTSNRNVQQPGAPTWISHHRRWSPNNLGAKRGYCDSDATKSLNTALTAFPKTLKVLKMQTLLWRLLHGTFKVHREPCSPFSGAQGPVPCELSGTIAFDKALIEVHGVKDLIHLLPLLGVVWDIQMT